MVSRINISQFSLDLNTKVFTFVNFLLPLILYIYWSVYLRFGIYFGHYVYKEAEAIAALYHFSELSILFLTLFLISLYNSVYIYFENLKYRILTSIFVPSFFIFVLIKIIPVIRDIYLGNIHILVTNEGIVKNVRADIFTESIYYSSVGFLFILFIMLIMFLKNSFSEKYKENFIKENAIYIVGITTVSVLSTILTASDVFDFYPILFPDIYNYFSYIIIFIPFYNSLILFFKYFNKEKILIIFSILAFYPVFIFTFPVVISTLLSGGYYGKWYYGPPSLTIYGVIESWIISVNYLPYMYIVLALPLFWLILYITFRKHIPFLIIILILNLLLIFYYFFTYPQISVIKYMLVPPFYLYNTNPIRDFLEFFNISIGILILINLIIPLLGISYKRKYLHV
jgi:hypothetical protein